MTITLDFIIESAGWPEGSKIKSRMRPLSMILHASLSMLCPFCVRHILPNSARACLPAGTDSWDKLFFYYQGVTEGEAKGPAAIGTDCTKVDLNNPYNRDFTKLGGPWPRTIAGGDKFYMQFSYVCDCEHASGAAALCHCADATLGAAERWGSPGMSLLAGTTCASHLLLPPQPATPTIPSMRSSCGWPPRPVRQVCGSCPVLTNWPPLFLRRVAASLH